MTGFSVMEAAMPKETVHDTLGKFDLRVGWTPNRDVQVGAESTTGRPLVGLLVDSDQTLLSFIGQGLYKQDLLSTEPPVYEAGSDLDAWAKRCDEWYAKQARLVLRTVEQSVTGPYVNSVWSTLDRSGCNRLIKTLRRARDAAFGRDE